MWSWVFNILHLTWSWMQDKKERMVLQDNGSIKKGDKGEERVMKDGKDKKIWQRTRKDDAESKKTEKEARKKDSAIKE